MMITAIDDIINAPEEHLNIETLVGLARLARENFQFNDYADKAKFDYNDPIVREAARPKNLAPIMHELTVKGLYSKADIALAIAIREVKLAEINKQIQARQTAENCYSQALESAIKSVCDTASENRPLHVKIDGQDFLLHNREDNDEHLTEKDAVYQIPASKELEDEINKSLGLARLSINLPEEECLRLTEEARKAGKNLHAFLRGVLIAYTSS